MQLNELSFIGDFAPNFSIILDVNSRSRIRMKTLGKTDL